MQAYSKAFAAVYDKKWAAFSHQVAPFLINFCASTEIGKKNKTVLDVCCGAGHLANHFLEKGYRVIGLDLSEHMLHYANENAREFVKSGQARFVLGDAAEFSLPERFGLVVSTYDSLNHLKDESSLLGCFRSVHAVCDGYFIFDLNTRKGLKRWNNVIVDDSENMLIITRGIYDGEGNRAITRFTGFVSLADRSYQRFDETVYNTVFELERVKSLLLKVGFGKIYFARIQDLMTSLDKPEEEGRVFVVAGGQSII